MDEKELWNKLALIHEEIKTLREDLPQIVDTVLNEYKEALLSGRLPSRGRWDEVKPILQQVGSAGIIQAELERGRGIPGASLSRVLRQHESPKFPEEDRVYRAKIQWTNAVRVWLYPFRPKTREL